MTTTTFLACALTAYGAPLALFVVTIAQDPVRIIILILSAFFWLLSLFCSALIWLAVVPWRREPAFGLFVSVVLQELFRVLIYLLLRKADKVLRKLTENEHTKIFQNPHILSYVVGLGFGLMSGVFSLINVLADSLGPGTLGMQGESQLFFLVSAITCAAMILNHTCWGVIAFDAMDKGGNYLGLAYVWAAHCLVSGLSLLNRQSLYVATVVPIYLVLLVSGALAFHAAGGSPRRLLACARKSALACVQLKGCRGDDARPDTLEVDAAN